MNEKENNAIIAPIIREQITKIGSMEGAPNMLERNAVQRMANDNNFHELVVFIEENPKAYGNFILHGEKGSGWDRKPITNQT